MAGKYDVDYNDKRLTDVTAEEKAALNAEDVRYGNMISESDKYYDNAINKYGVQDENGNWNEGSMAAIQTEQANKKTEQEIKEIEQKKDWTEKDYIKEQRGAYVDFQKQSDPYGVEAEKRAEAGLSGAAGYLATIQERNYNTYQNRVAVAREAFVKAIQGYDNLITDAKLQNSSVLAEIALNTLEQTTKLALEGFQYKNKLLQDQAAKKLELKKYYSTEWHSVLAELQKEKEFEFDQDQAEIANKRQQDLIEIQQAELKIKQEQWDAEKAALAAAKIAKAQSTGRSRSSYVKKLTTDEKKIQKEENKKKKVESVSATDVLNEMIKSGKSKDEVSNAIALALREGAITKAEAQKLRNTFTPRGLAY